MDLYEQAQADKSILRKLTTHYHVGWNMPGYLPEMDPWTFSTAQSARDALVEELRVASINEASWADEHDCDDIPCPTYGDECPYQTSRNLEALADDLNEADVSEGWSGGVDNLNYWVEPCTEQGCEDEED